MPQYSDLMTGLKICGEDLSRITRSFENLETKLSEFDSTQKDREAYSAVFNYFVWIYSLFTGGIAVHDFIYDPQTPVDENRITLYMIQGMVLIAKWLFPDYVGPFINRYIVNEYTALESDLKGLKAHLEMVYPGINRDFSLKHRLDPNWTMPQEVTLYKQLNALIHNLNIRIIDISYANKEKKFINDFISSAKTLIQNKSTLFSTQTPQAMDTPAASSADEASPSTSNAPR